MKFWFGDGKGLCQVSRVGAWTGCGGLHEEQR